MRTHRVRTLVLVLFVLAWLGAGFSTALAATRFVAANGTDAPTCGGKSTPCRSISRAIQNAVAGDTIEVGPGRYGDLDGDGLFTGAGDEAAEIDTGCDCMVHVDRPLTLISRDGAGATLLDAGGAAIDVVAASVANVNFGKKGKGFTLTGSSDGTGFDSPRENITVRGNRAFANGNDGFQVDGNSGFIVIEDNVAESNGDNGIRLDDSDVKIVQRNVAVANGNDGLSIGNGVTTTVNANLAVGNGDSGFSLPAGATAKGNAAIGNGGVGFELDDRSTLTGSVAQGNQRGIEMRESVLVTKCAVIGNRGFGILVTGAASTIAKTSIFGNDVAGDTIDEPPIVLQFNCGVNVLATPITVTGNFWGEPGGPGDDPADRYCENGIAKDDGPFDPVATSEIKVKPKAAK